MNDTKVGIFFGFVKYIVYICKAVSRLTNGMQINSNALKNIDYEKKNSRIGSGAAHRRYSKRTV